MNRDNKEYKQDKWDKRINRTAIALLIIIGIVFWTAILEYAFTVDTAIDGWYAITIGAIITIGFIIAHARHNRKGG